MMSLFIRLKLQVLFCLTNEYISEKIVFEIAQSVFEMGQSVFEIAQKARNMQLTDNTEEAEEGYKYVRCAPCKRALSAIVFHTTAL